MTRVFGSIKVSTIGMYRSPSMQAPELHEFYDALELVVDNCISDNDDVVLVVGDDNSHPDGTCGLAKKHTSV